MADLTIEQLEELLQKKRSTVKVDIVPQKKCSFIPIRNPKHPCEKGPSIFYGELGYCSEHSRSVQARKAKQALDEQLAKEAHTETSASVLEKEVPVVETISAEPKLEVKSDEKVEEKPSTKSKKVKEDSDSDTDSSNALSSSELKRPTVVKKSIRRNKWGNFEDPDTHIVFNARTKAAYGVQDHKSGKITALTAKHISICEKYHWKYHVIEEDESEEESSSEDIDKGEDEEEPEDEDLEDEEVEDEGEEEDTVLDGQEEVSEESSDKSSEVSSDE